MKFKMACVCLAVGLATMVACDNSSPSTSPAAANGASGVSSILSSTPNATSASLNDTVTLKSTAPTIVSPVNDFKVTQSPTVLVAQAATPKFVSAAPLQYRFLIFGPTGQKVDDSLQPGPTYAVSAALEFEKRHTWVVRAETGGAVGPWSATGSFLAPAGGYILGNEVYDPLIGGKTVGIIHGPVTFIPGVGVRLDAEESYIEYNLPQTLSEGEFSALVTGLSVTSGNEDPKLRVITMREGNAAINDNPFRMSIDKRGNGAVAFRFIAGEDFYAETVGAERRVVNFHEDLTYFVRGTWGGGFFNAEYREGGFNGNTVYNFGKGYDGDYNPSQHNAFVGSPWQPGDRGEPSSLDGMVVRQVWISSRPRPTAANK